MTLDENFATELLRQTGADGVVLIFVNVMDSGKFSIAAGVKCVAENQDEIERGLPLILNVAGKQFGIDQQN